MTRTAGPKTVSALAKAMTEAELQRSIIDACGWFGLLVFHSGDSRRDLCAGFPEGVEI